MLFSISTNELVQTTSQLYLPCHLQYNIDSCRIWCSDIKCQINFVAMETVYLLVTGRIIINFQLGRVTELLLLKRDKNIMTK